MGWIQGDLGLAGEPPNSNGGGRRLAVAEGLADYVHQTNVQLWTVIRRARARPARRHLRAAIGYILPQRLRRRLQLALDCDKVSDLEGSDDLADCEDDDEEEGDEGEADELDENGLKMGTPDNLYDLLNSLLTFAIVAPLLALIQIFIHFYWVFRMNTPYYRQIMQVTKKEKKKRNAKLSEEEEAALEKKLAIKEMEKKQRARRAGKSKEKKKKKKDKKAMFVAFPGVFVFPSLLTLCCTFFMTGLVGSSVELLAECAMDYSPLVMAACQTPPALVLTSVSAAILLMFTMLVHFWLNFRHQWAPEEPIEDCEDIEDPLYRWVSKVRVRILPKGKDWIKYRMDRERGEFLKMWENTREPERTERLLREPVIFYRRNASDAIDGLKIVLMNRTSGNSFWGLMYDFNMFFVQIIIAILSGLGPALVPGTDAATAQVVSIMTVQLGTAFLVGCTGPSVDRVDNVVSVAQFTLEGSQTLCLFLGTLEAYTSQQPTLGMIAFFLSVCAMMLPIVEKAYDAIIVQISILCRKDEFSYASCAFTMFGLLLVLPGLLAGLVGIDLGDAGEEVEGAMDSMNDLTEFIVDDVQEGFDAIAGASTAAAGVASNVAFTMRPTPKHHRSALKIQRLHRARMVKRRAMEHDAAAKMQAFARGKLVRKSYASELSTAREYAKATASTGGGDVKPGQLSWLGQQEMDSLRQERLQRARQDFERKSLIGREVTRMPVRMPDERSVVRKKTPAPAATSVDVAESSAEAEQSDMNQIKRARRRTLAVQLAPDAKSNEPVEPVSRLTRADSFTRAQKLKATANYYETARQRSAVTRDHLHDIAGILYTRANPRAVDGHQGTDQLRVAVMRMKRARARKALPKGMPPQMSLFRAATLADAAYQERHFAEESSSDESEKEQALQGTSNEESRQGVARRQRRSLVTGLAHGELPSMDDELGERSTRRWKKVDRSVKQTEAEQNEEQAEDEKAASDDGAERSAMSRRVASARTLLPGIVPPSVATPGVDTAPLTVAYSVNVPPTLRADSGSMSVGSISHAGSATQVARPAPMAPPFAVPGGPRRAVSRAQRASNDSHDMGV